MTGPNSLGELIRERRLARGLSLGQLATAVGRTAATVRSWERGQHQPAADVVERLAQALRVEVADIESFMYQEPPSLTVVGDISDDEAITSESTTVSGEASIETAEGEGDDDSAEIGEVESAMAEATTPESAFVAASADELGIMPRIAPLPAKPIPPGEPESPGPELDEAPLEVELVAPEEEDEVEVVVVGPATVEPPVELPSEEVEGAAVASIEADDESRALVDEPTAPIGPPIAAAPAAAVPGHVGVAVRAETLREPELPPFLAPLRAIFDPRRKWLYWIRGTLTLVVLLGLLVVLGWAAGELFDGLGDVLDTIESTDSLTSGLVPGT